MERLSSSSSPRPLLPIDRPVALIFVVTWLAGALAFHEALLRPPGAGDEGFYLQAIHALDRAGTVRGVDGFFYAAAWASAARTLGHLIGATSVARVVRLVTLCGSAFTVAVGARFFGKRAGMVVGPLALLFAVDGGVAVGNVSGAVAGCLTVGLVVRSEAVRALVFALSASVKPFAIGSSLARRHAWTLVPLGVVALTRLDSPNAPDPLRLNAVSNLSGYRALLSVGLNVPWSIWTIAALLIGMSWAGEATLRALVVSWIALPLAWEHTTILLFIPWCAAFASARDLLPNAARRLRELCLVLAGLTLALGGQMFGPSDAPSLRVLGALLPFVAALGIARFTPSGQHVACVG